VVTCKDYTGIDPFTKQEVDIARILRDRKMQRALKQFFNPEHYFEVREALLQADRGDLIGAGCDALIPAQPPKEALTARRERANAAVKFDHMHTVLNKSRGSQGYRPGRLQAKRRDLR
jgi:Domain of unknown function (DUF3362)